MEAEDAPGTVAVAAAEKLPDAPEAEQAKVQAAQAVAETVVVSPVQQELANGSSGELPEVSPREAPKVHAGVAPESMPALAEPVELQPGSTTPQPPVPSLGGPEMPLDTSERKPEVHDDEVHHRIRIYLESLVTVTVYVM